MKKIYALYCIVRLTKKPEWLDDFREKYDKAYDFHLTLKQAAYIDDCQIRDIRKILDGIFADFKKDKNNIGMTFDNLVLDNEEGYIYLFTDSNQMLDNLQRKVRNALKEYSEYVNPESSKYEYDFKPHITIARELNDDKFKEAVTEIENDYVCKGEITEIVLSCIKEISVEEAHNPDNLIRYKL